jgi:hypothetical protein
MSIAAGTALVAQAPVVDLTVCMDAGYTIPSGVDATGASAVTYQWYENGGAVGNSNTATLTVAAGKEPGDYAYVRVATNADCPGGVPSNTYTVRVLPVPTNLLLTASPAAICVGTSSTLTASATTDGSYSLDNSTWQAATTFTVTPDKSASYTLYVKNSTGCSATLSVAAAIDVQSPAGKASLANALCGCTAPLVENRGYCLADVENPVITCTDSPYGLRGKGNPTYTSLGVLFGIDVTGYATSCAYENCSKGRCSLCNDSTCSSTWVRDCNNTPVKYVCLE